MSGSGEDFRVRPGRIRSTRAGKSKSFINQVLRAAKKAGHTASRESEPASGPASAARPSGAAGLPSVATGCSRPAGASP